MYNFPPQLTLVSCPDCSCEIYRQVLLSRTTLELVIIFFFNIQQLTVMAAPTLWYCWLCQKMGCPCDFQLVYMGYTRGTCAKWKQTFCKDSDILQTSENGDSWLPLL